jgi:hypothetical protein
MKPPWEDGGMSAFRDEVAASGKEGEIIRTVLSAWSRQYAGKNAVMLLCKAQTRASTKKCLRLVNYVFQLDVEPSGSASKKLVIS